MNYDADLIKEKIAEVLADWDDALSEQQRFDIAFHMTDWLHDLDAWHQFCSDPGKLEKNELEKRLLAFLIHVPSHVAAASKLLMGVPVTDVFGIGAVSERTEDAD